MVTHREDGLFPSFLSPCTVCSFKVDVIEFLATVTLTGRDFLSKKKVPCEGAPSIKFISIKPQSVRTISTKPSSYRARKKGKIGMFVTEPLYPVWPLVR